MCCYHVIRCVEIRMTNVRWKEENGTYSGTALTNGRTAVRQMAAPESDPAVRGEEDVKLNGILCSVVVSVV